jgi:hypothetical protein
VLRCARALVLALATLAAGCGGRESPTADPGAPSVDARFAGLYALLPPDGAIGDWTLDAAPTLADNEADFERLVDGAAPRYIDRGWVGSLLARYRQGSAVIEITAHDMQTEINAQANFSYDRPAYCEALRASANLETQVSGFETRSHVARYYLEIVIHDGSDAAKEALKLFTFYVLDHWA